MDLILFSAYRVMSRLYFHLPFVFLLFWQLHITYIQAVLFMAAYSFSSTLVGPLFPVLMKQLRLRTIIVMAEIVKSIGLVLTIAGTFQGSANIGIIYLAQVLGGVGFTIALSADGTLLSQLAKGIDQGGFAVLQGKIQSYMFLATLAAGFAGGVLYDHNASWPFIGGIIASLTSTLFLFFINEGPPQAATGINKSSGPLNYTTEQSLWIPFYVITRSFSMAPFLCLLPLFFYYQNVDPYLFGLVLGLFTLGGFVTAKFFAAGLVSASFMVGVGISLGGILVSFLLFSVSITLSFHGGDIFLISLVAIMVLGMSSGTIRPIVTPRLGLSDLSPEDRITLLSRMESYAGYMTVAVMMFIGLLGHHIELSEIFGVLGIALLVLALGLFLPKINRRLSEKRGIYIE